MGFPINLQSTKSIFKTHYINIAVALVPFFLMARKFLSRLIIVVAVAVLFKIKLSSPPCQSCVSSTTLRASYDFIVIGGGTAGSIIAAELAANPRHSVLLVEAGGYTNSRAASLQTIPGYQSSFAVL